jgi:hypothetical protein
MATAGPHLHAADDVILAKMQCQLCTWSSRSGPDERLHVTIPKHLHAKTPSAGVIQTSNEKLSNKGGETPPSETRNDNSGMQLWGHIWNTKRPDKQKRRRTISSRGGLHPSLVLQRSGNEHLCGLWQILDKSQQPFRELVPDGLALHLEDCVAACVLSSYCCAAILAIGDQCDSASQIHAVLRLERSRLNRGLLQGLWGERRHGQPHNKVIHTLQRLSKQRWGQGSYPRPRLGLDACS